jgi:hypothetical protein
MPNDFKVGFLKTLWILRDYLSVIVIGGGWVPLIYYHYLLADKSRMPIMTRDIDLFVDTKIPVVGKTLLNRLLLNAGFEPVFKSSDIPPVVHYEGIIEGQEVEIEFLTNQRGAKDDVVIEVQKGLQAEALRFLSISISDTIEVTIDDFWTEGNYSPLKVKVPSPEAYIFHKGLIFGRRSDKRKKAKDLYYIFDILANCPEFNERIIEGLRGFERKYPSWFSRFIKGLKENFSDLTADGILMVSSQRPAGAFSNLTDDQFKEFILGIFQELIEEINTIHR